MRTLFVTLALIAASSGLQAQVSVGGGLAFGFDLEQLGILARGAYDFTPEWRGNASFVFYLGDGGFDDFGGARADVDVWELNFDAHYTFSDNDNVSFYGIGGFNVTGVSASVEFLGSKTSSSDTEFNVNLGVGGLLSLTENLKGFGELKYAAGGASQLGLAAGVLVPL